MLSWITLKHLGIDFSASSEKISHAIDDEEDDFSVVDDGSGKAASGNGGGLAKLTSKWDAESGKAATRANERDVTVTRSKVNYRTKGKPIKVFVELAGQVHVLRCVLTSPLPTHPKPF